MTKKLLGLAAAALVTTVAFSAAPVDAQRHHSGYHGYRWKTVCKTRWVHHRKVRQCHRVRVRRYR